MLMDRILAAASSHRVEGLQGSLHYAFILHREQRARVIHVHLDHEIHDHGGVKGRVNGKSTHGWGSQAKTGDTPLLWQSSSPPPPP